MDQIGRYVIHREIGRGGFGRVYQAWDPVVHRNVAIKVLAAMSDPGMLARFRSEAGTTGSLKHRNIITIYDFGEHEEEPYIVMELLEGLSLRQIIQDGQLALLNK